MVASPQARGREDSANPVASDVRKPNESKPETKSSQTPIDRVRTDA
jgi:hypothetical protein